MANDQWNEVAREGDLVTWKPAEGEEIQGILTGKTRDVGVNKSTLYEITEADDTKVVIWETSVLKSKLEQLEIGTEVKISYLGKRKSKNGPGSYHDYKVLTRTPVRDEAAEVFLDGIDVK